VLEKAHGNASLLPCFYPLISIKVQGVVTCKGKDVVELHLIKMIETLTSGDLDSLDGFNPEIWQGLDPRISLIRFFPRITTHL
jgi:hypothetical protein